MALLAVSACSRPTDNKLLASTSSLDAASEAGPVLPEPPFALSEPAQPPPQFQGSDLSTMPVGELLRTVRGLAQEKAYGDAAIVQRWLVIRNVDGAMYNTMYNLACYESRANHLDPAIYWLERAAREEGFGLTWATRDPDLARVRQDSRWPALLSYFRAARDYWARTVAERANRVVPRTRAPAAGFPLVIGLHGFEGSERFFDASYQPAADHTKAVFLALSGTIAEGPNSFEWAEDVTRDQDRIDRGLQQLGRDVPIDPGHRILLGFSEGAQLAAALLAKHPDAYAGAIVFSPDTIQGLTLSDAPTYAAWQRKSVVIRVGAGEAPDTISHAEAIRDHFVQLGARVDYHAYPEQKSHSFPPDAARKLEAWVKYANGGD
jgi:predicted esterase